MYPSNFAYHRPKTLAEAAALLQKDSEARILAGGHSLLPAMRLRLATPSALVDLAGIDGLDSIRVAGDSLRIGARVTHAEVAASAEVAARCPLLAETASLIGDIQVRNRGTIGGSVAHADPGADYPTALLALGATVETGGSSSRRVPISEFYDGLFATVLERGEIVVAVSVPVQPAGSGSAYLKHRHPASSYAVVGAAAQVAVASGKCASVRVAVGGATVNPVRAAAAEGALDGKSPSAQNVTAAAERVAEAIADPLSDLYASGSFRTHLAKVLTRRALLQALERAR